MSTNAAILSSAIDATTARPATAPPMSGAEVLERAIHAKMAESQRIVDHVQNAVPQDFLIPSGRISFAPAHDGVALVGSADFGARPLTRFALGQAAARVGFPGGYANDVIQERGEIGRQVVAQALTTLWGHENGKKSLVRTVNDRVHAVLTDAYKRIDCRPAVDAFIGRVQELGAVSYGGEVTDTRIAIRAIVPRVYELNANAPGRAWRDSVAIGLVLRNSDFGAGRYSIALFVLRCLCLNGMIGENLFAQTHVGARLDEADFYSDRTHRLSNATMVSATRDYVSAVLSSDGVERTVGALNAAAEKQLDMKAELDTVLKKSLTKEELKSVTAALQSVDETEMPLGPPTAYRMANALSWVAGHAEDGDRRLDLQRLAGSYLTMKAA